MNRVFDVKFLKLLMLIGLFHNRNIGTKKNFIFFVLFSIENFGLLNLVSKHSIFLLEFKVTFIL